MRRVAVSAGGATPVLYLAPWVDFGGADSGTVDWFRHLDPDRYRASLLTTQVSPNRRLAEVAPHAAEVWAIPDILDGRDVPAFILDHIASRGVRVVHVMNSRLGYQMIPDIKRLPDPPAVVVQFHLEEPDRSGYVRYLCTRYGNLVDAFSVVGDHVAATLQDYGIPRDRCEVIRLGIDTDVFDPAAVEPVALEPGPAHILYAGRLTAQKDPWLMLEVAAALRDRGVRFQVHCVGDGDLSGHVAQAIGARGLQDCVIVHGPSGRMPSWYAACDIALMTSAYEGVPCVLYEAMAMALPLVVPALPGNAEVLDAGSAVLIDPRDDVDAYVDALSTLSADPARRRAMGTHARDVVCRRFPAAEMGARHAALYDRLVQRPPATPSPPAPPPAPIRLRSRRPTEEPLVSVVIPCHDDGRFLVEALASVKEQTYPSIEVIVVDDASTDRATGAVIDRLERESDAVVLRHTENLGPAAARNRALEVARGRYVLPLDADNVLVPEAVERMVRQLRSAGEQVGFVYPDQTYFGNRRDHHPAPAYNLHTLLRTNTCDTGSLIDREVFDAGVRFDAELRFGHEDWDLFITLAERDVRGEPARQPTMATRKAGFTRSDLIDRRREHVVDTLRERHRSLYAAEAALKARWSPALSIIALTPIRGAGRRRALAAGLAAQSCIDCELIVRDGHGWPSGGDGIRVRTIHPELARDDADALAQGAGAARGQLLMAVRGDAADMLADPAFVEKTLRMTARTEAVVLVDPGDPAVPPMRILDLHQSPITPALPLLDSAHVRRSAPVAVAWRAHTAERLPDLVLASAEDPLIQLTEHLSALIVEWRQAPPTMPVRAVEDPSAGRTAPSGPPAVLRFTPPRSPSLAGERTERLGCPPLLPTLPEPDRPEWYRRGRWEPPLTYRLRRFLDPATGRRVVGPGPAPQGFVLERELGWINRFPLCGTVRLIRVDGGFTAVPPSDGDDPHTTLGYLEEVAFCGLDAVHLAVPDDGGPATLVAGDDDPLRHACTLGPFLGRIEPPHVRPSQRSAAEIDVALAALRDSHGAAEQARTQLELTHNHAAELERRLAAITSRLPVRAYRRARSAPGADLVARALRLVTRQ